MRARFKERKVAQKAVIDKLKQCRLVIGVEKYRPGNLHPVAPLAADSANASDHAKIQEMYFTHCQKVVTNSYFSRKFFIIFQKIDSYRSRPS